MKSTYCLSIIVMAAVLTFSGCSEEKIRTNVEAEAQNYFNNDAEYVEYKNLEEKGLVDSEGKYIEAEEYLNEAETAIPAIAEVKDGSIHISFAKNPLISINYYRDEAHTIPVTEECYLNPGDSLYYSELTSLNSESSNYKMKYIRAIEYNSDGNRLKEAFNNSVELNSNMFSIPTSFTGNELSIEPVGEYIISALTFEDQYITANWERHPANGKWIINKEEMRTDSSGKLEYTPNDPLEETSIEYEYDVNEFYFYKSEPEVLNVEENAAQNGQYTIAFPNHLPDDENTEYIVYLSRYIDVTFTEGNNKIISVKKNGETVFEKDTRFWSFDFSKATGINKLKQDDLIEIIVQDGFTIENNPLLDMKVDGQRYSFTIPFDARDDIYLTVKKS